MPLGITKEFMDLLGRYFNRQELVSFQIGRGVPAEGDHIRQDLEVNVRGGQQNEGKKMFFGIYKSK